MKAKGITRIGSKHDALHTYVSVREWSEHWPSSIMIEQGLPGGRALIDDIVLLESEEHAIKVVKAIRAHAAQLGWEV